MYIVHVTLHNYIYDKIGRPHKPPGAVRIISYFILFLKADTAHSIIALSMDLKELVLRATLTISPQCGWQDFPFDGATRKEEWLYARLFPCHTDGT